jgi:peptidoglycan/LPS O-acetylase OafA/YrhL
MTFQVPHFFGRSLSVAQALDRRSNNFDLFRLIAALAVIYGHAFGLSPAPGFDDSLFKLTGHHSAAVAVKFFFFLSGLLVTDSLLTRQSVLKFFVARFFRIWPALAFVLLASIFIIGPVATNLDLATYFTNSQTFLYFKHQILMQTWGTQSLGYYNLPGVFTENNYKHTVNASLWSLVAEVFAYITLVAVSLIGLLEKRLSTLLIALIVLDSILPSRIIFTFLPVGNEDFSYLPFCFAIGAFFAIYKDRITIDTSLPVGFALLTYLFKENSGGTHFFYLTIFSSALYLATRLWVIQKIRLPFDVSYGTFLWGFPIQQLLSKYLPNVTGGGHVIVAMLLAVSAGTVSWLVVEKRSISIGKRVAKAFSRFELPQNK